MFALFINYLKQEVVDGICHSTDLASVVYIPLRRHRKWLSQREVHMRVNTVMSFKGNEVVQTFVHKVAPPCKCAII